MRNPSGLGATRTDMLRELRIENLLLIEKAEIQFGPGLNVITGETGAGKTVLAHALDLITGGKPRSGIVRPGAKEAYVEGVFDLESELIGELELGETAENLPQDRSEIVLARKVSATGRSSAYAYGRTTSAENLREIGTQLIAFFGQHEHRALMLSAEQIKMLDEFCGDGHMEEVKKFRSLYRKHLKLSRRLDELHDIASNREREIGILDFEIGEIDEVVADLEEADELMVRHRRLANLESLRSASLESAGLIEPEDETPGIAMNLSTAVAHLDAVSGVEGKLDEVAERCRGMACEAQELARELRSFEALLEGDPGELTELDERLGSLNRLFNKHGPTAQVVLEKHEELREKRSRIDRADDELAELEKEVIIMERELKDAADRLTRKRKSMALKMKKCVCTELSDLDMPSASFNIEITDVKNRELGQRGRDSVEFRLASNPGVAEALLKEAASGGELSRVMLAIVSAARTQGGWPIMVFDEIDAGIGGTTANSVGKKLKQISGRKEDDRQVVCITHLPQVAALADKHFSINKRTEKKIATASVDEIAGDDVVQELCRMLGADEADSGAKKHAQELIRAA